MTEGNTTKELIWQLKGEEPQYYTLDKLNEKIIKSSELRETKEKRKKESLSLDTREDNLFMGTVNEEKWKYFPPHLLEIIKLKYTRLNNNYSAIDSLEISKYGRVKINGVIKKQADESGKTGYLKVVGFPGLGMVYNLEAIAWLEKPDNCCSECICDVHHITNNGYDNKPENLIWLKRCDHSRIDHKIYT
jgi:hypothetical protein